MWIYSNELTFMEVSKYTLNLHLTPIGLESIMQWDLVRLHNQVKSEISNQEIDGGHQDERYDVVSKLLHKL